MQRGLALLLTTVCVWACLLLDISRLEHDERERLVAGYNLATYGVASLSIPDGGTPTPDMRREPVYPFLLSLPLRPGEPDLSCLLVNGERCTNRALALRAVNVLLLVVMTGLTFALARQFVPQQWALSGAAAAGFSPALAGYSDRLMAEPLAAVLLLAGTYCLVRLTRVDDGWVRWSAAAGTAFGVLVLVKPLFLFVVPAVAIVLALARGGRMATVGRSALSLGMAALIVAPWSVRNAIAFGSPMPSSGATDVLAVRVESMSMTGNEYLSSFVYYSGPAGPRVAGLLFGEENVRRHDRTDPSGFFLQAMGKGMTPRTNPQAVILDQPWRYLALTFPFAWQGAFGTDPLGNAPPMWWWQPLHRMYYGLVAVGIVLRWAGFLAFFALLWLARRDKSLWCFLAPSGLLFAAYAMTSHFIPRYGLPLLPVTYVCLAILGRRAWQRHASRRLSSSSVPSASS